jgi:opine dehydrogenase
MSREGARQGPRWIGSHHVSFWRRDAEAVAQHKAAGSTITVKDVNGCHDVTLDLVTTDIAQAVNGAELILCPAPAFAQADIARLLAPHLSDGQVVFLPPATFGTMIFAKAAHDAGNKAKLSFAETGTLPWLTRKHGPFEVAITIRAKRLPVGVFPLVSAEHALEVIDRAFPGVIEPCGDALSGALMNAGCIIHPPLIVMNAGPIEHFERWDIHKEGTQGAIRRVTDALDAERIAVREALGYRAPHFPLAHHYADDGEIWMYGRGSHDRLTDSGDWRERLVLTEHRYMREDLRLGLSFLISAAELTSTATPLARAFLSIGGAICGENFTATGRTLASLGLGGLDRAGLQKLMREGFPA